MNRTYFLCLLRTVPTNTEGFSTVYDCAGKDDLNKATGIQNIKLVATKGLKAPLILKFVCVGFFILFFVV